MRWLSKALVARVFSTIPFGDRLTYLVQRYVTRSLPTGDSKCAEIVSLAREHLELIQNHRAGALDRAVFYEFGAGCDLIVPLAFYAFGVNRQLLIDIRRLLRIDLVNTTIRKLQRLQSALELSRTPTDLLPGEIPDALAALDHGYGLEYRAPCDARATGLADRSVDCITSTNTLEHVPPADIEWILRECHRILRDDGCMSFRTDYQDHYSYFDPHISAYNFLRYSDRLWTVFSPSLHFQNRLRHADYCDLFHKTRFEIVEERPERGSPADLETVRRLPLANRFRAYSAEDLAVRSSLVLLRKRGS
ncbi:MAG: class I SAM-dependent methyltransferase [Gammaproteobacteria bacterium]